MTVFSLSTDLMREHYGTSILAPPLEEIRTEVFESGQKRWIKTPGVSGNMSPCLLVIRSAKTHLNTRSKQGKRREEMSPKAGVENIIIKA